eukprot:7263173-Heterocapsa_arctica.AAC.1
MRWSLLRRNIGLWGPFFDGEHHCVRPRGEKAWTFRGALRHAASGSAMTGRQLEVLIGHYVVEALYTRPALS